MRRLWFTVGVCRRWPRVPQLHKPHKHTQHMYADSEHGSRTHMYSECVCWFKVCGLYCTFIEQSHRHSMRRRYTSKSLGVGGARRRGGARGEVAEVRDAQGQAPQAQGSRGHGHGSRSSPRQQGRTGTRRRLYSLLLGTACCVYSTLLGTPQGSPDATRDGAILPDGPARRARTARTRGEIDSSQLSAQSSVGSRVAWRLGDSLACASVGTSDISGHFQVYSMPHMRHGLREMRGMGIFSIYHRWVYVWPHADMALLHILR